MRRRPRRGDDDHAVRPRPNGYVALLAHEAERERRPDRRSALRNPSSTDHAIALGKKKGRAVSGGGVSRITLQLKKGSYTYYCPVDDHRAAGMRGTLTVR